MCFNIDILENKAKFLGYFSKMFYIIQGSHNIQNSVFNQTLNCCPISHEIKYVCYLN